MSKNELITCEAINNIQKRFDFPLLFFIPVCLFDKHFTNINGSQLFDTEKNISGAMVLRSNTSLGFHFYDHDQYIKKWLRNDFDEKFFYNDLRRGLNVIKLNELKMIYINRYPGLIRDKFTLELLERFGFKFDSSDIIKEMNYCISPTAYRLFKINDKKIIPSLIYEIPLISADEFVISSRKEKINHFLNLVTKWKFWNNSIVALMFHDKVISISQNNTLMLNMVHNRLNLSANLSSLNYMIKKFKKFNFIIDINQIIKDCI